MYFSPKAFHGMVLMLSCATPSSSMSSFWEEKGQEEDDLYTKYVRRTSSRAASTKDDTGSGGSPYGIQATPRELKAGKKTLPPLPPPFAHCGPAAESTACDIPTVFSDLSALGDFCVGCPDMEMTVSEFSAVAKVLADADPFCSTFVYGYIAETKSTPGFSLGDDFLDDSACLVKYVQGVSQIQDESFIYKIDEEYKKAVLDFCVHKCGEYFWGLLGPIQMPSSSGTEEFIYEKCSMTSQAGTACITGTSVCDAMEHSVIGANSCNGNSACKAMQFSVVGPDSCIATSGESSTCHKLEASIIGSQSCIGRAACNAAQRLTTSNGACLGIAACGSTISANISNGACVGLDACLTANSVKIGDEACLEMNACVAATSTNIGNGACDGTNACNSVTSAHIGTNSCIGEDACHSASSVKIGNGACLGYAACFLGKLDVGNDACTCDKCCFCDEVNHNVDYITNGIPDGKCTTLGEVGCCPTPK
jgi:hypothetical protein